MRESFPGKYENKSYITALSEKEQAALDFFLAKNGALQIYDSLSADDLRVITDITLDMGIRSPKPRDDKSDWRNEQVELFTKKSWSPTTGPELRAILDEPLIRISRASKAAKGNRKKAVLQAFSSIDGYWKDARTDMGTLNLAMDSPESGPSIPNITLIRTTPGVLKVIAKHLRAQDFLDRGEWPLTNSKEYRAVQKYWEGAMLASARHGSDPILRESYDLAREVCIYRLNEWTRNRHLAAEIPSVKQLYSDQKTYPDSLLIADQP